MNIKCIVIRKQSRVKNPPKNSMEVRKVEDWVLELLKKKQKY